MNEITFQDVFRELRILPITAPDFFSHLVSGLISNRCNTDFATLALQQCFGYQIINSIINTTTEVHYCQLDVATVKFSTLSNFSTMYVGQMTRMADLNLSSVPAPYDQADGQQGSYFVGSGARTS